MRPELTIVIPVFNRAGIVAHTLDSVRHQTLRPLSVVLVDNNSSDESLHMLQAWKEHVEGPGFEVKVLSEKSPGAAAARNRGLREVSTEFTMFFDSDDIMLPPHAERALNALKHTSSPDLVGWDVEALLLNKRTHLNIFTETDMLWTNLMHGILSTQRYAARTDLLRKAGGWNEDMRGWDDIEFGTRILLLNPKVKKLEGSPSVKVIAQAESITGEAYSPAARQWEHALDSISESLASAGHPTEAVDLRRAILAGQYIAEGSPEDGIRLMAVVRHNTSGWVKRQLLRFACRYTALGMRGAARLMRPFFKI